MSITVIIISHVTKFHGLSPTYFLDLTSSSDLMWRQSVWSSLIASAIAAKHLKEGGLLTLTGAKAALEGTPGL